MYLVYRCDWSSGTNHLKDPEDHGDQDNRCFCVYLASHNRIYERKSEQARKPHAPTLLKQFQALVAGNPTETSFI